ncbi:hypothetical protein N7495_007598 [Penicillium taxi]|uniref:uncharacterized protein n=1 Tax=Penicillium taxi TaxID=168475 RepID=UPI0025456352|nr:uncharacterized protein N7495_007598 [Penicillium taxi]KAJ5887557.1 hypothetical protein N7495_007598 [Penicillium taxi]
MSTVKWKYREYERHSSLRDTKDASYRTIFTRNTPTMYSRNHSLSHAPNSNEVIEDAPTRRDILKDA